MARIRNSRLLQNCSGKIGNQLVIRRRGDKTFVSAMPRARSPAKNLPLQQEELQHKFKAATLYAKKALADPALKEAYTAARSGNQTAHNVAFLDCYEGPRLSNLRTNRFNGSPGQKIIVQAVDNFRVCEVFVNVFSADGKLVERGEAVRKKNSNDWIYTTRASYTSLCGLIIRVSARDLPGNIALLEQVL